MFRLGTSSRHRDCECGIHQFKPRNWYQFRFKGTVVESTAYVLHQDLCVDVEILLPLRTASLDWLRSLTSLEGASKAMLRSSKRHLAIWRSEMCRVLRDRRSWHMSCLNPRLLASELSPMLAKQPALSLRRGTL